MNNYSILSRSEYFSELVRMIDAARPGDRIAVASMNFEPKVPAVKKIADALTKAAARGVKVNLAADAYSFMAGGNMFTPGPLFWSTELPKHMSKNHALILNTLEEFKRAGGNYAIINRPSHRFTPPFKGRSHIKFAVINDYVFVGNCNLDKADQIDLMIGWRGAKAADWLYDLAQKAIKSGSASAALGAHKDQEFKLPANSRLLADAGRPGQSLIFKEALKLIDSAQKTVIFACQYFPDKAILDHLVSSHNRGVKVRLIYNHPLNRDPVLAPLHYLNKAKSRITLPAFLFKDQLPRKSTYLHAKLLATDQAVIIGSHNLVEAGVKFGTAELVLQSNDRLFSKRAVQKLTELLD